MVPLRIIKDVDYYAEITAIARSAKRGDRLGLASMNFAPEEPGIGALMHEVIAAARRGVTVLLHLDATAFMLDGDGQATGPLSRGQKIGASTIPPFTGRYALLQELAAAGGSYAIVNQPGSRLSLPVAGRSHIKTFIHNTYLYIGGCNLQSDDQIDWMAGLKSAQAADWFYSLLERSAEHGSVRQALSDTDRELQIDHQTTLLVDAGKPRQSLILQNALRIIDQAHEQLLITCQFFPNSVTATHLARALKRGVQVTVIYNHPSQHIKLFGALQQVVLAGERLRLPNALFHHQLPAAHQRLHAKIIASEKSSMIGSHNYVKLGVQLGTAEVALLRHDPVLARRLTAEVRRYLTPTHT